MNRLPRVWTGPEDRRRGRALTTGGDRCSASARRQGGPRRPGDRDRPLRPRTACQDVLTSTGTPNRHGPEGHLNRPAVPALTHRAGPTRMDAESWIPGTRPADARSTRHRTWIRPRRAADPIPTDWIEDHRSPKTLLNGSSRRSAPAPHRRRGIDRRWPRRSDVPTSNPWDRSQNLQPRTTARAPGPRRPPSVRRCRPWDRSRTGSGQTGPSPEPCRHGCRPNRPGQVPNRPGLHRDAPDPTAVILVPTLTCLP